MTEKIDSFYKMHKVEVPINITPEKKPVDSVIKALSGTCELALKQPIPGKQLI